MGALPVLIELQSNARPCFQLKRMETMAYTLVMVEDYHVKNLQPAVVKVYDYYQKSMNVHHTHTMGV